MGTPIHTIAGGVLAQQASFAELRADPIWSDLDALVAGRGFAHWTFSAAPAGFEGPAPPVRVTSYPAGHVATCVRQGLFAAFPGVSFASRSTRPARFGALRESLPQTPRLRSLLALNREHGVTRGVAIPLRNHFGMVAVAGLVFDGSDRALDAQWGLHGARIVDELRGWNRQLLSRRAHCFASDGLPRLTRRQTELLRFLAQGLGTKEIAGRMGISLDTVNKHAAQLRRRMRARSTAAATALAASWGLLDESGPD